MSDETKDVNNGEDRITHDHSAGVGSSADDLETHNLDLEDFDDIVKTLEDFNVDGDEPPGEAKTTDDSTKDGEGDSSDEGKDDAKIPKSRLDEVISQRNDFESRLNTRNEEFARLEGRLQSLEQLLSEKKVEKPGDKKTLPLDDIFASDDPQSILDAFQEDPKGFLSKYQERVRVQLEDSRRSESENERAQARLYDSLDSFGKERSDFLTEMPRLIDAVANDPKHNVVSAYAYTVEIPKLNQEIKSLRESLEAAKKEAFTAGKKKAVEEIRAKHAASTLDGSQSTGGGKVSDDVMTSRQSMDGLRERLTEKLKLKRAAQG